MQMLLSLDEEDSNNSEKFGKRMFFLETKKGILQSKKLMFLKIH